MLARHLLGRDGPVDCVAAYVSAHEQPVGRAWQHAPDPASRFALARPWAIGPIDAAGAISRRAGVLRAKLLLMTAILETSPELADRFLPARESPAATLIALAWDGLRVVAAALIGLPIVLTLGRDPA